MSGKRWKNLRAIKIPIPRLWGREKWGWGGKTKEKKKNNNNGVDKKT